MDIKEKVKELPVSSGVYIMKDEKGSILYVGKADNLRKRVANYFQSGRAHSERIGSLAGQVRDITYIPTSTSAEALIYENSLIKQFRPKYNVALRDDKSYPMLKLTVNEKFPRLLVTRQKKDDGSVYYGPYTSAKLLRGAVAFLRQIFQFRSCRKMPKGVCVNYHIKQCFGPCVGKIDEGRYRGMISELQLFIEGARAELLKVLSDKMASSARDEDFEEAARLRNRIQALNSLKEETIFYRPADEAEELKRILGLKDRLEKIEAFDVSNIQGKAAVGSMVSFYKGRSKKSEYRKFRIKSVSKVDDYGMMREIVSRRYKRLLEEKGPLPDLIIIDGGKGHLNVALEELNRLGLTGIPAVGIAKPARLQEKPARAGGEFERIYMKDKAEPVILPRESKALHLLQRIRDEAHRFAISYHKKLLSKKIEGSELDNVPGIGPKRRRALLVRFGSVDNIKKANIEDLLNVEGMDKKSAESLIGYFKG